MTLSLTIDRRYPKHENLSYAYAAPTMIGG